MIAMIAGLAWLFRDRPVLMTILVVLAGLAPMPIYRAKDLTRASWRLWRFRKRVSLPRPEGRAFPACWHG